MLNEDSGTATNSISKDSGKRTESLRKMAGKLARSTGHHRRSVQLLSRIIDLVNARAKEGSLAERCLETLEWLDNHESEVLELYVWSKLSVGLAKAVMILAVAEDPISMRQPIIKEVGAKAHEEASKLAKILIYSEKVHSFAHQRRSLKCRTEKIEYELELGAAELQSETVLYSNLPVRLRKQLEMTNLIAA